VNITINGELFVLPASLTEITLQQRIEFHKEHGSTLDEMTASIIQMPEGIEKEIEFIELGFERLFRSMSFFTGIDINVLKESEFIDDIAAIYYASVAVIFDDEKTIDFKREFIWKDETWQLAAPELKNGTKLSFGEFIDSKQILKDMHEIGAGKWESMLPLCAIYLRKSGEAYDESFVYDGSERMELMKELPLNICMHVAFFLSSFLNISINTLTYLKNQGLNQRVGLRKVISDAMGGSISLKL
jgi:hypothetical protein